MLSTTEQTILQAMESVTGQGRLERVKKMKDFAFVHFTDRESAKAAMDYWHSKLNIAVVAPVHHFDLCFVCVTYKIWGDTWWRSWMMHYATSRKATGLVPYGVTGFFH